MKKFKVWESRTFLGAGAILILLINAWVLSSTFDKVSRQEALVQHTSQVIMELEKIASASKDTETGVRGFIITGRNDYLTPYTDGRFAITSYLNELRRLTQDNPAQVAAVVTLTSILDERLRILASLKEGTEKNSLTQEARVRYLDEGRLIMTKLRDQVSKMQNLERSLLEKRSEEAEKSRQFFYVSVGLVTLFSVLVLGIALNLFRKNQLRSEIEAAEKTKEAWGSETQALVTQAVSGDISVAKAAENVGRVFSERFKLLVAKIYLIEGKTYRLVSQVGEGNYQPNVAERSLLTASVERGQIWQIDEIPTDHFKIRSSLGESLPKALIFIPIRFQGQMIAIIEAGTLESLHDEDMKALTEASEIIGIGINSAKTREQLKDLLERTQQQAEELEAQQEELRTNNEELEQQARVLESQQQSLNIQNEKLEHTRRELEEKAESLARASQYKSDFLARMSHELRTPLNGLLILATLLLENKENNLNDRQKQFAKSIHGAGQDLLVLINDILDLSKIEARKLALRPENFSLAEMLRNKKINFGPQAEAKNIEFHVEIPDDVAELEVFTDRQRFEQILRNFVSNAIKFTDKGSVTVSSRLTKGGSHVEVSVKDTGIGIPRDKQDLIFEAFEQVDSSERRNYGGTGLGLTISRELAELLGGSIRLESEPKKGSQFTVEIPVRINKVVEDHKPMVTERAETSFEPLKPRVQSREHEDEFSRQAVEIISHIPKNQRTILIVEDDERFRKSVAETADGFGFYPIEAGDGELAISILDKHVPDAILLDIKLPGISGLGLLEMIKQIPQLRHVPVHMISAMDYEQNALKRGALGYLTKPVTIEKVRAAISRIETFVNEKLRQVLVIEDDARQSEAISALISGPDVNVSIVKYGKDAVERIKTGRFDCIILDLTLPDYSGFDLLNELNNLPISLPAIVIYTGKDLTSKEEDYLRKFSDSIIIKGARSPERLLDEVNLFLHRVESLLPTDKRDMLTEVRKQDAAFEGKTVLIADDDMRNIFALTNALESKGLKVRIAKNGLEAIQQLEEHRDINLVLMDIMMPKMDGYEAMAKIREHANRDVSTVPIIALTAKAMREDHERCIQAGANDYIPKPVNLANLLTAMRVWLEPKGF